MRPALVDDDRFLLHRARGLHPERPERLLAARAALNDAGMRPAFEPLPARPATAAELQRVHHAAYVAQALRTLDGGGDGHLDADTFFSAGTRDAALAAAGGAVDLACALVQGDARGGLALLRPPGHHATPDTAMGFCIFNNVAAAAAAALATGRVARVLIVDWDVHHGNGTQDAFWEDDRVLYFSSHQFPFYPGTGRASEIGAGRGRGFTLNVPLPAGCGDAEYAAAYLATLVPAARRFRPDLVLVSAGFDAYAGDPLAEMEVTPAGFAELGRLVRGLAPDGAPDRIGVLLEGGYALDGLGACLLAALRALLFDDPPPHAHAAAAEQEMPRPEALPAPVRRVVEELRRAHDDRWWSDA
ncbi:MAG TPA: histone deacetylase [Myxococcota bacterium]|jgi:acetoin utilization deacetylase AcuC-like enzyme|nr:histone deacetylase [Myxococcota bacterium]